MNQQTPSSPARLHPLIIGAATSVILVSLLGVAAITGVIPASHSSMPTNPRPDAQAGLPAVASPYMTATPVLVSPTRYVTSDGQLLDVVPSTPIAAQSVKAKSAWNESGRGETSPTRPQTVSHNVAHHHTRYQDRAQNTYSENRYRQNSYAQNSYSQPRYIPQQHPVQSYVSDMHPVGTGVGAVVGGLLGNQVGGGNGKKLATIAGALVGGYAGNEVAHNRNPLQ